MTSGPIRVLGLQHYVNKKRCSDDDDEHEDEVENADGVDDDVEDDVPAGRVSASRGDRREAICKRLSSDTSWNSTQGEVSRSVTRTQESILRDSVRTRRDQS